MKKGQTSELDHVAQTKALLDGISKTACGAKWFQTTLHLFNGNTQSCHHVKSHRVPLKEILKHPSHLHNSSDKVRARKGMLAGKKISECDYCWNVEGVSGVSDRHIKSSQDWSLARLSEKTLKEELKSVVPTYVEVAFDNLCNLKCMYCSPVYSSSWDSEIRKFGPYPTSRRYNGLGAFQLAGANRLSDSKMQIYKDAFWKWWPELKKNLKHLRITGGEPLMSADFWKLLDQLEASEEKLNFILSLNTNLMLPENKFVKLVEKLNNCHSKVEKIVLFTSIDTVGKQAEYLRFGLSEELFYKNLKSILDNTNPKIQISFMITVNALSLLGLPNLLERIADLKLKYPEREIDFDTPYLNHPYHLSVRLLPEEFDSHLDKAIEVLKERNFSDLHIEKVQRISDHMKKNRFSGYRKVRVRRDFRRAILESDRRRKTDFRSTFPEYVNFFDSIWDTQFLPNI